MDTLNIIKYNRNANLVCCACLLMSDNFQEKIHKKNYYSLPKSRDVDLGKPEFPESDFLIIIIICVKLT